MQKQFTKATQQYIEKRAAEAIAEVSDEIDDMMTEAELFGKSETCEVDECDDVLCASKEFEKFARGIIQKSNGAIEAVEIDNGIRLHKKNPGFIKRLFCGKIITLNP